MSSMFLNSLFTKYQPGEAWFPSGFDPAASVASRNCKTGPGDPAVAAGASSVGWRGMHAGTAAGHYPSFDFTNSNYYTSVANTPFSTSYGYQACGFASTCPQVQVQSGGYTDQYTTYPHHNGYTTPNVTAYPTTWSPSQKDTGFVSPVSGAFIGPGPDIALQSHHEGKALDGHLDSKGDDGDSEPVYKGPVYNWMKIPGERKKKKKLISYCFHDRP